MTDNRFYCTECGNPLSDPSKEDTITRECNSGVCNGKQTEFDNLIKEDAR